MNSTAGGDLGPAGSIRIAEGFDFKAVSREVRSVEQTQSLDFSGGVERMGARPAAFKGTAATAWSSALEVLGEAHREAMKPLPGFADNVEDAGIAYHGTDGGSATDISSII